MIPDLLPVMKLKHPVKSTSRLYFSLVDHLPDDFEVPRLGLKRDHLNDIVQDILNSF